jgi:hypothetical protein
MTRPPFEKRLREDNLQNALKSIYGSGKSFSGIVYSEESVYDKNDEKYISLVVRDVPMGNRRYATREVYFYKMG